MKVNENYNKYVDEEKYATTPTLESDETAREIGKRNSKWKKQQPAMTVLIALALGRRKLEAELLRRVETWKRIPFLTYFDTNRTQTADIEQYDETSTTPNVTQKQN